MPMRALQRLTVSLKELSSLGWYYGTRARLLRLFGLESHIELRAQYADLKPTDIADVDRMPLRIVRLWPRQLLAGALAFVVVVSFAFVATNRSEAEPAPDPLAGVPALAPASPEPAELATLELEQDPKPVVKKRRVKRKKHRKRRRR